MWNVVAKPPKHNDSHFSHIVTANPFKGFTIMHCFKFHGRLAAVFRLAAVAAAGLLGTAGGAN